MSTEKVAAKEPDYTLANPDVIEKYRFAGTIAQKALTYVKTLVKDGAQIWDVTKAGDDFIESEVAQVYNGKKNKVTDKGIGFPTTISPNSIIDYLTPTNAEDKSANLTLKDGDVVKIHLGAQIDGFASIVSETVVVGASKENPVTGKKADLLTAAYYASEAAIRNLKPGKRNYEVTKVVDQVAKEYGVVAVQGMLSHNQERNVLTGPNEIIINPSDSQKSQVGTFEFELGQVYGLDILVSAGTGKVKQTEIRTTIYKLTGNNYKLKLKSSHAVFTEMKQKAGSYPFSIKNLDNPTKGRAGLKENVNHSTMIAYDIYQEKDNSEVAQVYITVAITKNGLVKFTSAEFDPEVIKSDIVLSEDLRTLVATSLKTKKVKPAN